MGVSVHLTHAVLGHPHEMTVRVSVPGSRAPDREPGGEYASNVPKDAPAAGTISPRYGDAPAWTQEPHSG